MRRPILGTKGFNPGSKVVTSKITDLAINPRNARTHPPTQIQEIARSIKRFGFNNPVLIDESNQLIAGHGRVEAAKLLGHKTVPALRLEHMTDEEKRAYIIADNKLAEKAGWAPEILAVEFQALIDLGFDVELTGFDIPEIEMILCQIIFSRKLMAYGTWANTASFVVMPAERSPLRRFWVAAAHSLSLLIPLLT
jgi:hypothetical protein